MTTYYCIDKENKTVLSAGPVPEVWGNISGMKDLDQEDLADLTWANYANYGFLTRGEALEFGILSKDLDYADYIAKKLSVPEIITMRQLRLALLNIEKLDDVENAITDRSDKIEWEYATEINRYGSRIINILQTINMSENDIDDLFILAHSL
jgi:hypothetical protein